MKKAIVGSVLAAGVAASLFGAGSAAAAPGVSYSDGNPDHAFNVGDNTKDGAVAVASPGNRALAVSLIGPSQASAKGVNNNAFAFDGVSSIGGGTDNNVATSYGVTNLAGGDRNTVVNAGSMVTSVSGQAENQTSVSFCGVRLSAQSSHITTGNMPKGGLC